MLTRRDRRINHILNSAPPGAHFQGFGGSSIRQETLVFSYKGDEYRLPVYPKAWKGGPTEIGDCYGCFGLFSWADFEEEDW